MIHQFPFLHKILLITLFLAGGNGQNGPIASTKYGELEGRSIETPRGTVNVWLGIPYAAPPIGSKRFEVFISI